MFGAFFGFFGEYISVDAHKNQMLHDISVNCDLSFRLIFEQNSESRRNGRNAYLGEANDCKRYE